MAASERLGDLPTYSQDVVQRIEAMNMVGKVFVYHSVFFSFFGYHSVLVFVLGRSDLIVAVSRLSSEIAFTTVLISTTSEEILFFSIR